MESEIEVLNKKIGGEYVTIDGHKIFRLVWSESIFENRYGTFREFTESGIFLRETTEVRRVRKYNYIHNRWVFEMWAPGNLTRNRETPDADNGDYVPVYVFEARNGNYLPPTEKVVRFLIAALYGKVRRDEIPSQEYLDEREIDKQVEMMDDHPAWFQTRPGAARNAIWYKGGVPKWDERKATFDVKLVRDIERKTMEEARERNRIEELRRETELAQQREKLKAELAAAEFKKAEVERETREHMNRVYENELRKQREQQKEPEIKSPMHHR